MSDPIQRYIPASSDDWQYARSTGNGGGLQYMQDNPAWTEEERRKALEHQAYLANLMQRQSGWSLNEKLVGKGLPNDPKDTGGNYDWMRIITKMALGQPYGFLSPPLQSEVQAAADAVRAAQEQHTRRKPRGLLSP